MVTAMLGTRLTAPAILSAVRPCSSLPSSGEKLRPGKITVTCAPGCSASRRTRPAAHRVSLRPGQSTTGLRNVLVHQAQHERRSCVRGAVALCRLCRRPVVAAAGQRWPELLYIPISRVISERGSWVAVADEMQRLAQGCMAKPCGTSSSAAHDFTNCTRSRREDRWMGHCRTGLPAPRIKRSAELLGRLRRAPGSVRVGSKAHQQHSPTATLSGVSQDLKQRTIDLLALLASRIRPALTAPEADPVCGSYLPKHTQATLAGGRMGGARLGDLFDAN